MTDDRPKRIDLTDTAAKPSIAELQEGARRRMETTTLEDFERTGQDLINTAPVLLEIAASALAWRDQRAANLEAALMRTDAEIEAEDQDARRARVKRTADLASAIEAALAKVRP